MPHLVVCTRWRLQDGRYVAKSVDDFSVNAKSNWLLPSRDELDAVYNASIAVGVPKVLPMQYWTSSENSPKYAWYQLFQDGTQFTDETCGCRCEAW